MSTPLIHGEIPSRASQATLSDRLNGILPAPQLHGASCARLDRGGKRIWPPDLWFPHTGTSERANLANSLPARQVCRHCPVRVACLDYALELDPIPGIWGGFTEQQRARIRSARKAGVA